MPKIKELTNDQLGDYRDAYQSLQSTDPNNAEFQRKIKSIDTALYKRDLINFDLPGAVKEKKSFIKKLLSIFKKNK